jgi:hypothetical protein
MIDTQTKMLNKKFTTKTITFNGSILVIIVTFI